MSLRLVGPIQYRRLIDAMRHYERYGFRSIEVPWAVSKEAMDITRPAWAGEDTLLYVAGGTELRPVASAEQSYLQMQLDALRSTGIGVRGSYVTLTPCFRNEPRLDELHQPYFMKVELISWDRTDTQALQDMIDCARDFFEMFIDTDVVENHDNDPIAEVTTLDIVEKYTGIEVGSYGIRNHPSVGRWLYGTGCAEPRLSVAIETESLERWGEKKASQRPF